MARGGTTAELYVRSLAPDCEFRAQEAALARLDDLTTHGVITGYDVHIWGAAVSPDGAIATTATGQQVLDRLASIGQWADESGRTVDVLRTAEHYSRITGERRLVTRLPSLALAEFDGGELVHFAPCRDGDRDVSVSSRLDTLGGRPTFGHGRPVRQGTPI